MRSLGNLFSFRFKFNVRLFFKRFQPLRHFNDTKIEAGKNQAYIFLAADYGNLGDVAITYAQTKFLKENTKYQVIEIPISKSLEGLWFVKKNIKKGDLITTVGGGNLGDIYDQIEYIRQLVVKLFPKNRVVSFPQTFDFSETTKGKKALSAAQKVYNNHSNIHIVARERISYNLMKKYFPQVNVIMTPDIVLSLNEAEPKFERNGVVLCLRQDQEKSLTEEQNNFVIKAAKSYFNNFNFYDTHIGRSNLTIKERTGELKKIWDVFRKAELVITDRLHGMIFCYITNTPCLVFQNNNHKVKGTFEWFNKPHAINLMETFDEMGLENILKNRSNTKTKNAVLTEQFKPLVNLCQ